MARPLIILNSTSCHCLTHKLPALISPSCLSFSTSFLYEPSLSTTQATWDYLELLLSSSSFLTSSPISFCSLKRSFPEIFLLYFVNHAEYSPTFCLDAVRDKIDMDYHKEMRYIEKEHGSQTKAYHMVVKTPRE